MLKEVRIEECRKSECLSVIERIGIETLSCGENQQTSTRSLFARNCKEALI